MALTTINGIELAEKFQPILDEIYKKESLTARLDGLSKPVDHNDARTVYVYKTSMVGLGDYDRATGFAAGNVTGVWEALELTKDRGRAFSVDAMSDEETLGMAFGTLVGEFIRTKVVPELDAYRFATYAGKASGKPTAAALTTSSGVLTAIDLAQKTLDGKEVPREGRVLYASEDIYYLLKGALTRTWVSDGTVDRNIERLDGMDVVMVPQTRFYEGIDLIDGSDPSTGGYGQTSGKKKLNFLLLHPSAVLQIAKHNPLRVFAPDLNQTADAWLFQYRIYHDAFVYDNKTDSVYVHRYTS
ncbi:MAG TPA: hypothetical protein PLA02_05575 [Brevefilum fermentans]|jgi:hypothetical protein|nr:hypothetical protein [Brevefilum fermentans]